VWKKSVQSALCIIPDEPLWRGIQNIRLSRDVHVNRWMPHINILFPFVTADQLQDAAHAMAAQLADFAPFDVRFDEVGLFSHRANSHTFWLSPQTTGGSDIARIHRAAVTVFPSFDDTSKRQNGFCPHLTLGQAKGPAPDAADLRSLWPGGAFTCSRVFLIARSSVDDPFHVRHVVSLGGGRCTSGDWLYSASANFHWLDVISNQPCMAIP
jgi:2'-5' RNA ligase